MQCKMTIEPYYALLRMCHSEMQDRCMELWHTFAQVNLVATLDRVLSKVSVCEAFQIHQSNLASSNLHIRKGINDVWYQTCMNSAIMNRC